MIQYGVTDNSLGITVEQTVTDIKVTNVFRRNCRATTETVVNVGGAGSSKSYSVCQKILFKRILNKQNRKILILRKTRKSVEMSIYKTFIDMLQEYGIYDRKCHNKSKLEYTFPGINVWVVFSGLDDREKIKSTEWDDIVMEEASQFTREDYLFSKTRLFRGFRKDPADFSQVTLLLNPVNCWVKNLGNTKDVTFIHSTYKDNPFMNKQAIDILENLKHEDETYYLIYAKGLWATPEHIVYKPFLMLPSLPEDDDYDEVIYGLDFGYNVQTGLLQIGYMDAQRYLKELIYRTKLTNSDLIELLKELIPEKKRHRPIYADEAEPDRIQEICEAGFNCLPSDKAVKSGIDYCKRQTYYSIESNVNLNEERDAYKWKQDKDGNVLDDPVKFKDHLMDPLRYADYTHNKHVVGERTDIKKAIQDVQESEDSVTSKQSW